MCTSGKKQQRQAAEANRQSQEESLRLQREQLELARQAQERAAAQYQEQMRITTAPPPPAPSPVAEVAASALSIAPTLSNAPGGADGQGMEGGASAATPAQARQGYGRRRFRTDLMAGGTGGLSIPAA
jgi:hypothetical protein